MKILLIGGGGREHALAWKIKKSKLCKHLYIAPGNPGTAEHGTNIAIADNDIDGLVNYAVDKKIDLVVVGPEDALCLGVVDAMEAKGIKAFGPSKAASQLEGDKAFSKKMMADVRIPTAEGKTFVDFEAAKHYIAAKEGGVVVKATGLAKGKGVIVCDEPSDAIIAAEKILNEYQFGDAGNEILVEEKLEGQEASILAFVDGRNIYIMESAQDHKPIGEGDSGANTGGMGAYTPAPIVDKKIMNMVEREVLVPIVDGMNRMGIPYKGILYAGIMLTAAGPKVLEFNCRFGDPECQPILSRMKGDIVEVMLAVINGTLDQVTINWDKRPAICVVMSSGGYPGDYITGLPITGIAEANNVADTKVFHAGTKSIDGQVVTGGGRVLGITSLGQTIEEAQQRAYDAISKINFLDCYWRNDIADKAIKK